MNYVESERSAIQYTHYHESRVTVLIKIYNIRFKLRVLFN